MRLEDKNKMKENEWETKEGLMNAKIELKSTE